MVFQQFNLFNNKTVIENIMLAPVHLRIKKAKLLLAEDAAKIWAIAEACGFSNAYSFCRMFKKQTGMTPQEYRSRYKYLDV